MSDIPPPLEPRPRHWLEYAATGLALALSAISLWVAVGTMDANKKMVAAASWPFLQFSTSDGDAKGNSVLTFEVINAGVGPALVETLEVYYRGKPMTTSHDLLQRCCHYDPRLGPARDQPRTGSIQVGTVGKTVIRAGESRAFFTYAKTATNADGWEVLRKAVSDGTLVARACYCSVFDECWQGAFTGIHPKRVDRCEVPAVSYTQ
ncbi:MAG: hypothetical protein WDM91_01245 [Rhizomicrobium sp.]